MNDQPPAPQEAASGGPKVPRNLDVLADWILQQRGAFTDGALERSALDAGYSPEEYARAVALAGVRPAMRSIKSVARRAVLAAYGLVWLAFAVVFLVQETTSYYVNGGFLQLVLSISLGIALAISFLAISLGRPDPDRRSRAVAILLVVPVILLVGVAGLCVPFTGVVR